MTWPMLALTAAAFVAGFLFGSACAQLGAYLRSGSSRQADQTPATQQATRMN